MSPKEPNDVMSVSKIECVVSLKGRGDSKVSLFRHLAPVTVDAIVKERPISSRVNIYPKVMICLLTKLRLGVEKQKYEFLRNDVAFEPATGSICFFLSSARSDRPLNPIGRVEKGVELLESARIGDVIELRSLTI